MNTEIRATGATLVFPMAMHIFAFVAFSTAFVIAIVCIAGWKKTPSDERIFPLALCAFFASIGSASMVASFLLPT